MKTKTRHIVGATILSRLVVIISFCLLAISTCVAQEFANIEYLCPDWGPAMTWSGKTNESPKFSETEEEVYFIKQIGSFTRKKMKMRDPLSGRDTADEGHGISIWLCKMKPDGSEKTEIKELWRNPNYPIDTQGQSCWMDVNAKTRKIALAIAYAGNDITGLWTMNLDGSDLKRIIKPEQTEKHLQAINHPSWTPDGQWIVFEEELRGTNPNQYRIVKCDSRGGKVVRLTNGPQDRQPCVSPEGTQVTFIHWINWGSLLWLMDLDGSNQRARLDPDGKLHGGTYPSWSSDGKEVLLECRIIDVASGKVILERCPMLQGRQGTYGWPHWGKLGILGLTEVGGILLTDVELKEAKWIGSSKLAQCSGLKDSCRW
jgi:Tol biopolymer transport system component